MEYSQHTYALCLSFVVCDAKRKNSCPYNLAEVSFYQRNALAANVRSTFFTYSHTDTFKSAIRSPKCFRQKIKHRHFLSVKLPNSLDCVSVTFSSRKKDLLTKFHPFIQKRVFFGFKISYSSASKC